MIEPFFSIIIPVYNSEKYLPRCLDSIINQDYSDFELLLIDDFSSDGSFEVCCRYSSTDNRIRVLRNERNEGVTITRNKGIEESTGRFVLFVDNDDYLESNYLSTFAAAYNVDLDADLIIQNILFHKDQKGIQIISGFDSLGGPWGKMFKRSILIKENVKFIPKLRYNEDNMFMLDYLEFVEKRIELDAALYHYTENEDCTSKKLEVDYEATGKGLMILLERIDADCFKTQFIKDFAENRVCFMFHRYVKSMYGHSVQSRKKRRNHIRYVCRVSSKALKYYPLQYKTDKIIRLLLAFRLYMVADIASEFVWRLRLKY